MKIETLILSNLIYDEDFLRSSLPHIKDEYFTEWAERSVFQQIQEFVLEYNAPPTKEALIISAQDNSKLSEDQFAGIVEVVGTLEKSDTNKKWLSDQAEKFCQDKALYNALVTSIQVSDGKNKKLSKDAIPDLLRDALAVSFDSSVGHDYLNDSDQRFEFYHKVEQRIPFDLEMFNIITRGGLPRKTLSVCMAGINVGKSLIMCHMAGANLAAGYNVLYITLEMSQEMIAERIDANMMNVSMDDLRDLPRKMFDDRITKIKNKTEGRLIIKEYPTASAHSGHFRALMNELQLKQDFRPDIVYIDYINICASSRYGANSDPNSYTLVKGIAEELRGLAMEFDIPIMTATQVTRSGFGNSEMEMTDVAESWGLPATADFFFAAISSEELDRLGQFLIKQLKSRLGDKSKNTKFLVGVDKSKMRVYDLDASVQKSASNLTISAPVSVSSSKFGNRDYSGIRVE
jgi:replicative DNA helicase